MCKIQLWIELSVAISTFLAVFVALFGNYITSRLFAPKFTVSIESSKGEFNTTNDGLAVRYYHLLIHNCRRTLANNCTVSLTKVESQMNIGVPINWNGDVPLTWFYPTLNTSIYRNIGPDILCDLICISENKEALFETYYKPNNFTNMFKEQFALTINVQVKSDQVTSKPYKFKLEWDGHWEVGAEEMARHFYITQLD